MKKLFLFLIMVGGVAVSSMAQDVRHVKAPKKKVQEKEKVVMAPKPYVKAEKVKRAKGPAPSKVQHAEKRSNGKAFSGKKVGHKKHAAPHRKPTK